MAVISCLILFNYRFQDKTIFYPQKVGPETTDQEKATVVEAALEKDSLV
ncbi:MAG: hypothetical protein K0M45_04815 [Candidatus Paracaedibacteraceae bacterium]|nr:hypothetical protein [Candidatus Paracaedibacteraceae bacterium]